MQTAAELAPLPAPEAQGPDQVMTEHLSEPHHHICSHGTNDFKQCASRCPATLHVMSSTATTSAQKTKRHRHQVCSSMLCCNVSRQVLLLLRLQCWQATLQMQTSGCSAAAQCTSMPDADLVQLLCRVQNLTLAVRTGPMQYQEQGPGLICAATCCMPMRCLQAIMTVATVST